MDRAIAWVESPLQLVAAAEWAAGRDEPIAVALRVTGPQMAATAAELLSRGARFVSVTPYFGIPWGQLGAHPAWAVGDAFSGQFRLAASVRAPRELSLLDDGAMTLVAADALLGRVPYARPHTDEGRLSRALGRSARERMLRLASRERLELVTAFALGDQRTTLLGDRGIRVSRSGFEWVRSTARPIAVPGNRVLVGSALPTDGRMPVPDYLAWVAAEARAGGLVYLPHRRETAAVLAAVRTTPGVRVVETGLPLELVLAGAREPLEVITLPTSARTTLGHVLAGTGSTIVEVSTRSTRFGQAATGSRTSTR